MEGRDIKDMGVLAMFQLIRVSDIKLFAWNVNSSNYMSKNLKRMQVGQSGSVVVYLPCIGDVQQGGHPKSTSRT